jgi:uncharacterized protein YbjT (DUF2867 family)
MRVLVFGSTGYLGHKIIKKLLNKDFELYAFHRQDSHTESLKSLSKLNLISGDIRDYSSVEDAIKNMDIVISTVSSAAPKSKNDNFENVDITGHRNIVDACNKYDIKQFIFVSSISFGKLDEYVPISASKRRIEENIISSQINYTVFRPTAFMDLSFALMGAEAVIEKEIQHTLNRDFVFARNYFDGIKNDILEKSRINIVGSGKTKVSYIAADDVAEFVVNAINNPMGYKIIIAIGGPEALSALEVKEIFEDLLAKPLKVKSTPAVVMIILKAILGLGNKAAANIMALNYAGASVNTVVDTQKTAAEFGVELTPAREFLRSKFK